MTIMKRYTVREICNECGLAESTIRNAMSQGRLEFEKDDAGRVLITEKALREYLDKSEHFTSHSLLNLRHVFADKLAEQAKRQAERQALEHAQKLIDAFAADVNRHGEAWLNDQPMFKNAPDYVLLTVKKRAAELKLAALTEALKAAEKLKKK